MFESAKAYMAEVRVERARAALRRAKGKEAAAAAALYRQTGKVAAEARKVERAARKWEAAREAETIKDLRNMARANRRRGFVVRARAIPDLEAPAPALPARYVEALFLEVEAPDFIL